MRHVRLTMQGTTALITLDRPDKLNALAQQMREQLRDAITQAARDEGARALVVTGAGRAFCAGGDVGAMAEMLQAGSPGAFHRVLHAAAECVLALQAFPGLTVAAVNGIAAGAGFALALNCDLRLATPEARFAASWGRVGLVPDWGATYWLPRMLGYARAAQLCLGTETIDAARALDWGIVSKIVPAAELSAAALEAAVRLGAARESIRRTRALLRKGLEGPLEASLAAETDVQEELFEGAEVAEGVAAFLDRRAPRFDSE